AATVSPRACRARCSRSGSSGSDTGGIPSSNPPRSCTFPRPGALNRVRSDIPSGTELLPGRRGMHIETAPSMPLVHVLGGLSLTCDGRRLAVPPGSRRLLAYLALHPGGVDRRVAAGVLWPDVE